jgi:hypothetical protein
MTQVLIDSGLPCFDDVLAKYAFTLIRMQRSVCNNRIIRHLQRIYGAMCVLALFGFTLLQYLDVSMYFFSWLLLFFVFVLF